ncbi:MAG TPA: PVC-type heme-binding CxxCH protein, partial [Vicinamibacteria bacterium]|nr:PVC-type heme-binding CxxCH protein [Vicinamibacteria bacterium]
MRLERLWPFLAVGAAAFALTACTRKAEPPLDPAGALQTFEIEDGFRIETFASEPDIASPVAMEWDERGRIFVVEMPGYPLDTRPTGRIKLLRDTDGDGKPDESTVFADGLVLPTGVMRWRKGVIVTAAPDVLYLEDTNDDGRADTRRRLLTGFAFTNPQHTVNSPVYGLDNWIYLAHEGPAHAIVFKDPFGDAGQDVHFPELPGSQRVSVGRHGVRFRPDTGELEALAGSSQFGHSFDAWGRYFTEDNANHLRHEVVAARHLARNPDLPVPSAMANVSDHGSNARVFAITKRPRFELLTEPGEFTSACALTVYTGGAFPESAGTTSFVAEPAQNLVHRDVLAPAGATFTGRRAREGVEFLASTDSWFRPVNLAIGPDGALYVVDYYRKVIEHPEWASTGVATSRDLYLGQDKGRIYRVVPAAAPPPPPRVDLARASDAELAAHLQSPNLWWRRTAQRLLVERGRPEAGPLLGALFAKSQLGHARLHALWTLQGLGLLDVATIDRALSDPEAGVRENAVRLAEPRLAASPALAARLLSLAADPDARVRLTVLAALGDLQGREAQGAAERLLRDGIEDEWMHVAALAAPPARASALLASALSPRTGLLAEETKGRAAFLRLAAAMVGARQDAGDVRRLLATVAGPGDAPADWWKTACLEGLSGGAGRRRGDAPAFVANTAALLRLFADGSPAVRHAALGLLQVSGLPRSAAASALLERARAAAASPDTPTGSRADAVALLTLADPAPHADLFRALVDPREPQEVQAAAVRGLSRLPGDDVASFLLGRWRSLTPAVRSEAADALLADPGRTRALVAALRDGQVQAWTLNFDQRRDIIMNPDPEIRRLGRPLLEATPGDREAVRKRYEAALDRSGDVARGRAVFGRVCAKCHALDGVGSEVGPDLGTVRGRAPELLLEDILVPNRSIAQKYESYLVETANGTTETGVMAGETPVSVVLRREGGEEPVIPRRDIVKMSV